MFNTLDLTSIEPRLKPQLSPLQISKALRVPHRPNRSGGGPGRPRRPRRARRAGRAPVRRGGDEDGRLRRGLKQNLRI